MGGRKKAKAICQNCKVEFMVFSYIVRCPKRGKYCSLECASVARRKRIKIKCLNCGVISEWMLSLLPTRKFCNNACWKEYREKQASKKNNAIKRKKYYFRTPANEIKISLRKDKKKQSKIKCRYPNCERLFKPPYKGVRYCNNLCRIAHLKSIEAEGYRIEEQISMNLPRNINF